VRLLGTVLIDRTVPATSESKSRGQEGMLVYSTRQLAIHTRRSFILRDFSLTGSLMESTRPESL